MPRPLVLSNAVLALLAAGLAWALYASAHGRQAPDSRAAADTAEPVAPTLDAHAADRLAAQLARIDARLAALEHGASSRAADAPAAAFARPDGARMSEAEADRRLGTLLPDVPLDHRALALFHARLSELPPADQFALSSAFSRAMNAQRVRIAP